MSRGRTSALKHATAAAAARLARVSLDDVSPVWRAQFDGRSPWWWSRRGEPGRGGRADLAAPDGTVCFATSATGALIEKLWDPGRADPDDPEPQVVTLETLRSLAVWHSSERPSAKEVADLTDQRKGLPKEFSTAPYTITQEWADEVRAQGLDGLVYWLRLDPADGRGVALFARGPDDGARGFLHELFTLTRAGEGDAYRGALPEQLFEVVEPPADDELEPGALDDVPDR